MTADGTIARRGARRARWNADRIEVPRTMEGMLDLIRLFLEHADGQERIRLYDVLSALRGPDDEEYDTKAATTAVVRAAALGHTMESHILVALADTEALVARRLAMSDRGLSHFGWHAKKAFDHLGLSWHTRNALPEDA